MRINLTIVCCLFISINIFFCINIVYPVKAQEFIEDNSLSSNFTEIENSEIGVKMKYPQNWTIQYTKGSNNSLTIDQYIEMLEADSSKEYSDTEKYQRFQDYLSNCYIDYDLLIDCNLIEDPFLRAFARSLGGYSAIFDYVPTLTFLSPLDNSTDSFLENFKIASFTLPQNWTFTDFADYYRWSLSLNPSEPVELNCQSNLMSDYPGCIYGFGIGHDIENRNYVMFQFFVEKNDKIYLISYNALAETYEQYIDLVNNMLKSFEPI